MDRERIQSERERCERAGKAGRPNTLYDAGYAAGAIAALAWVLEPGICEAPHKRVRDEHPPE